MSTGPRTPDEPQDRFSQVDPDAERVSEDELNEIRNQLRQLSLDSTELPDIADDAMPEHIGRFALERQLGSGSFGTVYLANDPKMSRKVAIKVAHIGAHANEHLRRRFLAEAHAAARMAHPNVVTVHECGEDDGLLYIVYQLCQGETLSEWLAEQPDRIEPMVAVEIVRQLAKGLAHAHVRGIVHRDIKPSNIVLHQEEDAVVGQSHSTIEFIPRITDFGLAHDLLSRDDRSAGDNLLGTIDFMSPEQVQGGRNSRCQTSDIYSLGVIMYRMLAGTLPSAGSNVLETLQQICSAEPIPIRYHNPAIPEDLAAICTKCLEKNPAERYPTCEALIADLNRWQTGLPIAIRPRPLVEQICRAVAKAPVVYALAMTVLLVSTTGATLLLYLLLKLQSAYDMQGNMLVTTQVSERRALDATEDLARANAELAQSNQAMAQSQLERIQIEYRADLHLAYEYFNRGQLHAVDHCIKRIDRQIAGDLEPCFALRMLKNSVAKARNRLDTAVGRPTAFAIVPNTNLVLYGGANGQICVHNTLTGHVEHTFPQPSHHTVTAIAVDPRAEVVAVGWSFIGFAGLPCSSVVTYRFTHQGETWLEPLGDPFIPVFTCQSLSFSPDGKKLAIGERYGPIVIKDLESDHVVTLQSGGRNRTVDFSPDGTRILVLGQENSIAVADAATGATLSTIPCQAVPQRARWTPDGAAIAYCDYNASDVVVVDSVAPFKTLFRATQSLGVIETLAVAPSGEHLIAGTRSGGFVAWDLLQGRLAGGAELAPVLENIPHAGVVLSTEMLDDCSVMSLDDAGELVVTSITCTEDLLSQPTPSAVFQLGGTGVGIFLAGFADGSIKKIDGDGQTLEVVCELGPAVCSLAANADGTRMAVGRIDGSVELWNADEHSFYDAEYPLPINSLNDRQINSIQFSPDGQLLAACGNDASLRVWKINELSAPMLEHEFTSRAYCLSFIGNGRVACGGMFEEVHLFDVFAQQKPVAMLPGTRLAKTVLFDASRRLLLSGHADGRVRLHSTKTGRLEGSLANSVGEITSLRLSPGGECYLVGTKRGQVNLWDAETHELIGTLHQFDDHRTIDAIEVRPDLRLLTLSRGAQPLPVLAISR